MYMCVYIHTHICMLGVSWSCFFKLEGLRRWVPQDLRRQGCAV